MAGHSGKIFNVLGEERKWKRSPAKEEGLGGRPQRADTFCKESISNPANNSYIRGYYKFSSDLYLPSLLMTPEYLF